MKVAVVGLGNVGTTLGALLLEHRARLGIERLRLVKCFPKPWEQPDQALLTRGGADFVSATTEDARHRALEQADYIFDCRKEGAARADRGFYERLSGVGVCAQGSEVGFGIPFVAGVNDTALSGQRLVQVASCNTHATTTLLRTLAGPCLEHLKDADFVIVRRSEDVGAHERLVTASVVARHRDEECGTHHATEARRVFETVGVSPAVTSSDITTPSQLMHAVRFRITISSNLTPAQVRSRCDEDALLSTTEKFDSNRVFELGRRYGFHGRIYAHAIVVANNLLLTGSVLSGWAFVPQEGNTVLSSVGAFLRFCGSEETTFRRLRDALIQPRW